DYVCVLLAQFQRDRSSVDNDWRAFFDELLSNTDGSSATEAADLSKPRSSESSGRSAAPATIQKSYDWGNEAKPAASTSTEVAPKSEPQEQIAHSKVSSQPAASESEGPERIPLRGPALKIAENMQASLSVPTATSQRQIPLKLLDENRQVINKHL